MKNSKMIKALLIVSGLIGIGIGAALLFIPVAFEASAGIILDQNSSLLSEVRAPGGTLFAAGILILTGAFIAEWTSLSLVLSSLFYLSYGISRLLSMARDGVPHQSIIIATVLELVIGILSISALFNVQRSPSVSAG